MNKQQEQFKWGVFEIIDFSISMLYIIGIPLFFKFLELEFITKF